MRIREEIEYLTKKLGRAPHSVSQFSYNKQKIIELKHSYKDKYGVVPSIKECAYLIERNLLEPEKCKHTKCNNIARFNKDRYNYCSRKCSDSDANRNASIQVKRLTKIDYNEIHAKVVATKNIVGDDGLTVHQRSAKKSLETRNKNYSCWLEKTRDGIQAQSIDSRRGASVKRKHTLYKKYGVTHFGGGYSKLKRICIAGREFLYQGYEDICLYDLVFKFRIDVNDIESCVRYDKHAFEYEYGTYYPDIFIISQNKYIEIKSRYWDNKDQHKDLKKQSVINAGFNFEKVVYDDKEYIARTRKILKEQNCYIKG